MVFLSEHFFKNQINPVNSLRFPPSSSSSSSNITDSVLVIRSVRSNIASLLFTSLFSSVKLCFTLFHYRSHCLDAQSLSETLLYERFGQAKCANKQTTFPTMHFAFLISVKPDVFRQLHVRRTGRSKQSLHLVLNVYPWIGCIQSYWIKL